VDQLVDLLTDRFNNHQKQFKSCPLVILAPISNDIGEFEQDRDDDDPLVEGEVNDSYENVRFV
jgi:hypothetical protein